MQAFAKGRFLMFESVENNRKMILGAYRKLKFCILKVLPTRFTSDSRCFLPQRVAQKLRRINKEISAMTKKQQADLDDSQPAERRYLFDVLPFSSNACSFTRECNADFYN